MPSAPAELNAIMSEKLSEQEFQPLMSEMTAASGDGSVAISSDSAGAVIVTGNGNRVVINHDTRAEDLVKLLHRVIRQTSRTAIKNRPFKSALPYKGLYNFELDDEYLFFGRDRFLNDLVNELEQTSLILLLGASGSGKSSVVRAGLIPCFKRKWAAQGLKGFNLTFKPDLDPFESLYGCLLSRYTQSEAKIAQEGKANTLMRVIKTLKPPDTQWLIFIDQFEELFKIDSEKCKNFITGLTKFANDKSDSSVKIIATMRSDLLNKLDPYSALEKVTRKHRPMITEMQPDELRLAIEQPAAHHGVVFETDLVAEIIKDVQGLQGQTVSLPLLQLTLELLWKEEIKTGNIVHDRTLNTATYRKLGGVRCALQQHVDKVYQKLSEQEQLAAKQIFLRIVGIAENPESGMAWKPVRQRVSRSEFDGSLKQSVVDKLIDNRLLISNRENGSQDSTIEIVHEILFTSWTTLSDWIQESRQNIVIHNDIRNFINRWQKNKSANELLPGSRLEQALELKKDPVFNQALGGFNPEENKFINISQRRRDLKRYGVFTLLAGYSLLATILLIVFTLLFGPRFFNNWGFKDYTEKSYWSSILKYNIAIAISSKLDISKLIENNSGFPLYNRALAYEKEKKFDAAAADYQKLMLTNPNFAPAYNNLAYLNIFDKNYNEAIKNLEDAQKFSGSDPSYKIVEYNIFKNLGWAQFELARLNNNAEANLRNAETNLMNAIKSDSEERAAYCLLAQLREYKKQKGNTKYELEKCIEHEGETRPE